jgi:hypothetical protein
VTSEEQTILDEWDIDAAYFTSVVRDNPSLRGMILGYIAERKLRDLLVALPNTSGHRKDDDHDRTKKGDVTLVYKGEEIVIEVKSLQTNSIQIELPDGRRLPLVKKIPLGRKPSSGLTLTGKLKKGAVTYKWLPNPDVASLTEAERRASSYIGAFQCDASDKRDVTLDNGKVINTTLLKVGEFDVIAAGIFSFRNKWEYGFALNDDLPRSTMYGQDSSHLIASLVEITYPLKPPFTGDPIEVFEKVVQRRRQ